MNCANNYDSSEFQLYCMSLSVPRLFSFNIAVCFFRKKWYIKLSENDKDNAMAAHTFTSIFAKLLCWMKEKNILIYIDYQIKIDATKNIALFILKRGYHMSYNK